MPPTAPNVPKEVQDGKKTKKKAVLKILIGLAIVSFLIFLFTIAQFYMKSKGL